MPNHRTSTAHPSSTDVCVKVLSNKAMKKKIVSGVGNLRTEGHMLPPQPFSAAHQMIWELANAIKAYIFCY
jgi:hypothetical protein